ncbi:hypothetical protein EVAR_17664_1 [Eumeta japonica]|uniref:Uncharacterized protein n=1 Tax=Eumeta variegata TaxID=151549 RepID=A0A4C1USX2_EUMVA|nr:hypothetical protein EVAR_17664_1 [Eumeta japonica]
MNEPSFMRASYGASSEMSAAGGAPEGREFKIKERQLVQRHKHETYNDSDACLRRCVAYGPRAPSTLDDIRRPDRAGGACGSPTRRKPIAPTGLIF